MKARNIKNWIGGFLAVAAMIGFLAMSGMIAMREIPVTNKDFFNMCLIAIIGFCSTAFGYYLGSSASSARKTEIAAEAPPEPIDKGNPQSGQARSAVLPILALIMILAAALPWAISGCAQQSATQQIAAKTKDPAAISLATFADAQDAYIEAAELYEPYQAALRASNPALDREIVGYLQSANLILAKWETYGEVPPRDKEALRDYLRKVSIRAARMIEEGGEHGQNR